MDSSLTPDELRAPPLPLSSSYARLPEHFYARLRPTPVARPRLIKLNAALALELGLELDTADDAALAALFAGNVLPAGAEPIAMAYAGHQFGHFVPQLGDGRAILLGELQDRAGVRRDLQLKGSGRTPYSRGGDGRAALGPVLREYLISEALHALTVPATRALAAVVSGEQVFRDRPLPGAVFTRVAASHIRVGTFQFFAAREDVAATQRLADYVIDRHYPEAREAQRPILALLDSVTARQAALVAAWMQLGFIHGVMNTDNMAVSGESIDFGPCAFMDEYDPETVFSSIDHAGRYAYANQPRAAQWNLARFAETLLPILDPDPQAALALASEVIVRFAALYSRHWLEGMGRKLGLASAAEGDRALIQSLLDAMHRNRADFTLTFRRLCDVGEVPGAEERMAALFANPTECREWLLEWQARVAGEPGGPGARAAAMRQVNPAVIPRNHRVAQAIDAAVEGGDFSPFSELLAVLTQPFELSATQAAYADPPRPDERVLQTFCGT